MNKPTKKLNNKDRFDSLFLIGDIYLRLLDYCDIEDLRITRNLYHTFFINSEIISKEQQINWFDDYMERSNDYCFVICDSKTDQSLGYVSLYNINWDKKSASLGRFMVKEPSPPMLGTRILKKILELCQNFELETITLCVLKNNRKAIECYERVGFTKNAEDDFLLYYTISI